MLIFIAVKIKHYVQGYLLFAERNYFNLRTVLARIITADSAFKYSHTNFTAVLLSHSCM